VELYCRVRRAVPVDGRSQREVAREFGISRKTIQKMLSYAVPPGYQRQQAVKRPKLGPWPGTIDAILDADRSYAAGNADSRHPRPRTAAPPGRTRAAYCGKRCLCNTP
jgi:hypothetical protein